MSYKQILSETEEIKSIRAEKQKKIILDIKEICDKNGIEIYPIDGTLLGFIRDGRSILHDTDADFYIDYLDHDKLIQLEPAFNERGYQLRSIHINHRFMVINLIPFENCFFLVDIMSFIRDKDKMLQLRFTHRKPNFLEKLIVKRKTDSFFLNKANYLFCYLLTYKTKRYVYPYKWFEKHINLEVYGKTFKIIEGYEDFLNGIYGRNWRTPDWNQKYLEEKTLFKKHYMLRDIKTLKLWLNRPIVEGTWIDGKLI